MAETVVYKVMDAADLAALGSGVFNGAPIDIADGFIHLSTAAQLTETVKRHFAGQSGLSIASPSIRFSVGAPSGTALDARRIVRRCRAAQRVFC